MSNTCQMDFYKKIAVYKSLKDAIATASISNFVRLLQEYKVYDENVSRLLLQTRDKQRNNIIHLYVKFNLHELLEDTLRRIGERMPDITELLWQTNEDGLTPLLLASKLNAHKCITCILNSISQLPVIEQKAIMMQGDGNGNTTGHVVVSSSSLDTLNLFLDRFREPYEFITARDTQDGTILHTAARFKQHKIILQCLKALSNESVQASVLTLTNVLGDTVLHILTKKQDFITLKAIFELLKRKALELIFVVDKSLSQTLFHWSTFYDNMKITHLFLERVYDYCCNTHGSLSKTTKYGRVLKLLLTKCDVNKETALHIAVKRGSVKTLRQLLKSLSFTHLPYTDVITLFDVHGKCLLILAAKNPSADELHLLLEYLKSIGFLHDVVSETLRSRPKDVFNVCTAGDERKLKLLASLRILWPEVIQEKNTSLTEDIKSILTGSCMDLSNENVENAVGVFICQMQFFEEPPGKKSYMAALYELYRMLTETSPALTNSSGETRTVVAKHILQSVDLIESLRKCVENKETIWHLLTRVCTAEQIHRSLMLIYRQDFSRVIALQNQYGKTPIDVGNKAVKKYMKWLLPIYSRRFHVVYHPPTVLVMYYKQDREDAEDEVGVIEEMMPKFGLAPIIKEGLRREEVFKMIRRYSNSEQTSSLVVVIMAHGRKGQVIVKDGLELNIDEVINEMCSETLKLKPKVLIIQACQSQEKTSTHLPPSFDAHGGESNTNNRLDASARNNPQRLSRYDISSRQEIAVVNSSAPGGLSLRNLMIPLLLDNIHNNGPLRDIGEAFKIANGDVIYASHGQVAKMETTMTKSFTLGNHFLSYSKDDEPGPSPTARDD